MSTFKPSTPVRQEDFAFGDYISKIQKKSQSSMPAPVSDQDEDNMSDIEDDPMNHVH